MVVFLNNNYTYVDGKVIITDDKGNKTYSEYYDDLDKVLVKENLVEAIEGKILELEEKGKLYSNVSKKSYFPMVIFVVLGSLVICPIFVSWISGNDLISSVRAFVGDFNSYVDMILSYSMILVPGVLGGELIRYRGYRKKIKEAKGINSELEFLREQLGKEKEKISNLKKVLVKENKEIKGTRTVKIDDSRELSRLEDYTRFYYDMGYNDEKYYKYYQNGKIEDKLGKCYTDDGIQLAMDYFKEKSPVLVRKKR